MKLDQELADVRHMLDEDTDIEGGYELMACACFEGVADQVNVAWVCSLKTLCLISSPRPVRHGYEQLDCRRRPH